MNVPHIPSLNNTCRALFVYVRKIKIQNFMDGEIYLCVNKRKKNRNILFNHKHLIQTNSYTTHES